MEFGEALVTDLALCKSACGRPNKPYLAVVFDDTVLPMPTQSFRFPGVLNSQEMLVAEAVLARAWEKIVSDPAQQPRYGSADKSRLGGIIVRLMTDRSKSVGDMAAAAVREFERADNEKIA